MNLSREFILRPVATTMLMAAIVLAGAVAYTQLPVSALPQVDYPTIQVATFYPGASPEIMAASVTAPLERQFGQMPGLDQMTSTSAFGSSLITLRFSLDLSMDIAEQEVQAAINTSGSLMPADLPSPPVYNKTNPADAPILSLALTSDTLPLSQVHDLADTRLVQKIAQVPGVGLVSVVGGQRPAVRIQANPASLASYHLGLEDLRTAILGASVNQAKGAFNGPSQAWTIATNDQLTSSAGYRPLVVAWRNNAPVRLSDVATVIDGAEDVNQGAWIDGTPAVVLNIQRQPNANIIAVVDRVKALLPRLSATLPGSIRLTVASDRTTTIRASVHDVQFELMLTIALVVMVIFLFLRTLSATIIPAIAVPLSLVGTLAVMYLLGYSLDNLSLMALTISTGFVVDDAIVMIENITRYIEAGEPPLEAALKGAGQIAFTIVSLTVSLVAVLIPLLFMGDVAGRLFREFAVTLGVTIVVSAIVSLTLTPMLCAKLLRHRPETHDDEAPPVRQPLSRRLLASSERVFDASADFYARSLRFVLRHQGVTLIVAFATLVLTVVLYVYAPKGFFPVQDTGLLLGISEVSPRASFEALAERQQALARIIRKDPAVEGLTSFIGIDGTNVTTNTGRLQIALKPLEQRGPSSGAIDVIRRLGPKLADEQGIRLYMQPVQDLTVEDRVSRTQYQYTLQSADPQALKTWAPRVVEALRALPDLTDVASDQQDGGLAARLALDRASASRLGITPLQIDNTLYDAFGQRQISTIFTQVNQYRVVLEAQPAWQRGPAALEHIYIATPGGGQTPLGTIARVTEQSVPLVISRQGQFPVVTISFNLAPGASLGSAVRAIRTATNNLAMPASVQAEFQGTAEAFERSLTNEPLLILAAIITVYIVLGVLYESYIHPLTILSTLPSAGVGAILALMLTGTELGVITLIGIILLIGIVKKNAIMMIDFALDAERRAGRDPRGAIYEACLLRFRPILMTTMAALFGALPVAFASGIGAELRRPLGVAIIGGLIVSQALTLFTTPVIYLTLDRLRLRRGAMLTPRAAAPGALMVIAVAVGLGGVALSGCAVGPRYAVPPVVTPPAFKEATPAGAAVEGGGVWQPANPRDEESKGEWWHVYRDAQLDALLAKIDVSNQNVKVAEAQMAEARALVKASRAAEAPVVSVNPSVTRSRVSATRSAAIQTNTQTNTDHQLPIDVSYDADVWGKVRNGVASSKAAYQASAADLETMRLSMRAELAANYFEARAIDAQEALLDETVAGYERGLALTDARHQAGIVSGVDVAQARTQLETARAQRIDLGVQRAQLEHAIAVLIGEPPANFTLATLNAASSSAWSASPPELPVGIPSTLLERRPDVAAAERRMRAANANIGIAKAAYFPSITLPGSGGFESVSLAKWLSWPSALWSIGAAVSQTVFDGGARRAEVARNEAAWDQAVATYRQTVLTAFQDVEDNASTLRILADEARQRDVAVQAAQKAVDLAMSQYRAGMTSYLDVITAQNALLANQRTALTISGARMTASVQLIKALGGGWDRTMLPL